MGVMRITKIEGQKKHPSRKSIFIDGTFAFGVSVDVLLKFNLYVGEELEQSDTEKILHAENVETAKQKVMRFLSIRPRSKKEIRDYLFRKEYAGDIADTIVAKLESLRMVDDEAFARMVCRDSLLKKPMGEKMLRQVLFKKGVPKPIIDSVMVEFFTSSSELAMAVKAAERQQVRVKRSSKSVDEVHAKKKLLDYLVRRGFSFDTALSATKKILSGNPSPWEKER
jgi:regulatory protein